MEARSGVVQLFWVLLLGAAPALSTDDAWGVADAYTEVDFYGRYLAATTAQLKSQCGIGAVCVTRTECSNRGDCVNGACRCDSTDRSGDNCQISTSCDNNCATLNRAPCEASDKSTCGACLPDYSHASEATSGTTSCTMDCNTVPTCAAQNRATCTAPNTCGACQAGFATVGSGAAAVCIPCSPASPCGSLNRATCANATAPNVCGACLTDFSHLTENAQGNSACISCPNNCAILNRAGCSVSGQCGACLPGFAGDTADTSLACSPCVCNSAADCNNKGECRNGVCKCEPGFIGATCLAQASTYGSQQSSQLVKDLIGTCGLQTECAGCNAIKKSLGKAVDCIWCPTSKICLDAADWETNEVAVARKKGEAHKCLSSSTTADCYELGVASKPCVFSTSSTECSAASGLGPSALLSVLAVAGAALATSRSTV